METIVVADVINEIIKPNTNLRLLLIHLTKETQIRVYAFDNEHNK
jgi:hypothetical protein